MIKPFCVSTKSRRFSFVPMLLLLVGLFLVGFLSTISGEGLSTAEISAASTDLSNAEKRHSFKISLQSGNSIVQNERQMASNEFYLQPGFNYYHTSGFYSGFSAVVMPSDKKKKLDDLAFNIGYDKEVGANISFGVDYTYAHYFTTKQAASATPHTILVNGSWYNKIITPTLSAIWSIGKTSDYTTSFDLMHLFTFKRIFTKHDKLTFPLITGVFAGTSNSYSTYTDLNKQKSGVVGTTVTETHSAYGLTSAYVLGAIKYRIGAFSIGSSLYYSLSFNPSSSTTTSNKPSFKVGLAYYF